MANNPKKDREIPALSATDKGGNEFQVPSTLDVDNYTCFGITGRENRPLCLKVLFNNGGMVLIHYGRMASPITYDGKGKIAVEAPNLRLEINGSNLVPLLDYLGEQRLAWIKSVGASGETDAFMLNNGEPEIVSIQIHPKNTNQLKDSS